MIPMLLEFGLVVRHAIRALIITHAFFHNGRHRSGSDSHFIYSVPPTLTYIDESKAWECVVRTPHRLRMAV